MGSKTKDQKNEASLQSDLEGLSSESFSSECIYNTNNSSSGEKTQTSVTPNGRKV